MRIVIIIILLFSMMGCSTSQVVNRDFTAFYNKYEDDAGVVSFQIPSALAKMFVDKEDRDADKFVNKMNKIRFFISEHDNGKYTRSINNYLPESAYNDLMIVKDDGSTVVFKMKSPKAGRTKEIVLTVSKPDSFVAISFSGDFTLEEAEQMTSSIKTDDIEDFNE